MNEIINKVLLAGEKFMHEMHLIQLAFMYSACRSFTKNKERIKKFTQATFSIYIYQNKLDKAFFEHDMSYGDFKNLPKRTVSEIVLRNEAIHFAKIVAIFLKLDRYQCGIVSVIYKFFDKISLGGAIKSVFCRVFLTL